MLQPLWIRRSTVSSGIGESICVTKRSPCSGCMVIVGRSIHPMRTVAPNTLFAGLRCSGSVAVPAAVSPPGVHASEARRLPADRPRHTTALAISPVGRIGKRERTKLDLAPGAHEVGVRLLDGHGEKILVRLREREALEEEP